MGAGGKHGVDSPKDGGRKGSAFLLALAPIQLIADAAERSHARGDNGRLMRARLAGKRMVRSGDPLGSNRPMGAGSRVSGTHCFMFTPDPRAPNVARPGKGSL
jgi:hypothetical protein